MKLRACLILLLCSLSAAAQGTWDGTLDWSAGSNFHLTPTNQKTRNLGHLAGGASFSSPKLTLNMSANADLAHLMTGTTGVSYLYSGKDTVRTGGDLSVNDGNDLNLGTGVSAIWTPDPFNSFRFSYSYSHNKVWQDNLTLSAKPVELMISGTFSKEDADNHGDTHDGSIGYTHTFKKTGRALSAEGSVSVSSSDRFSDWITGEGEGTEISKDNVISTYKYRLFPTSCSSDYSLNLRYSERSLAGVDGLNLDFTLNFLFKDLSDHSRASSFSQGAWRDSTDAMEDFHFRTSTLTPRLNVHYKVWKNTLNVAYAPEYYAQKLDSGEKIGDISRGKVAHLVNISDILEPWDGHQFSFSFDRSENRPSYLQICWFPRSSNQYSDELHSGNPDLLPTISRNGVIGYTLSKNGFTTTFEFNHTWEYDKIEETYSKEIINDKEYRVYTWINGGESHDSDFTLYEAWEGKGVKVALEGTFNYFHGTTRDESHTYSTAYSVALDLGYKISSWEFSAKSRYQSDMERSYSRIQSLVVCDAKIIREFKKFSIFLEGQDLFDSPITHTTLSEDETECRMEEIRYNRRLFIFGMNFTFGKNK